MLISHKKMGKCVEAGRTAIEARMLCVIIRPRACTTEDDAELKSLYALYKQYNALMSSAGLPARKTAKKGIPTIDKHEKPKQGEPS
jgi:hypothetical protein